MSNCVVLLCNSLFSSSAEATDCLHSLTRPGTAKAGGGDFVCGNCDGTSAGGRQRYSSKAGATSCSLCPVGGRVNGARTTCSALDLYCSVFIKAAAKCSTTWHAIRTLHLSSKPMLQPLLRPA